MTEAASEIERLDRMVAHASAVGVTFPPDTLPKSPGAAVMVECPVCNTVWEADNHDRCPTCALPPQGLN
jgi:rubrerythrin